MRNYLIFITLFFTMTMYSQECYSIKKVDNYAEIEGVDSNRFKLGVRQISEEILSDKYEICENGTPINVIVESIEAPTNSVSLGPFSKVRKKTIVKVKLLVNGVEYDGVGESNTDVKTTFIELQDENLPFEKSSFSNALKKSLLDAISKL
jgi:hypothetical protein